ncbi:hypothetical protein JF634_06885 [Simonsiella muelleri]|jgi:hypothetical protein|uniref:PepSY domain-containing protein n=2 Tax=Simonsiella TaxID=71 RepID=V9HB54_9NEIS|nr:hypothetical protein [Simonsiella muelleri]AUX62448.1 hypothetical protein BWP33_12000 [Simonsiella muelleri ATCC 29453]EFG30325.2 hypothetical protein HMPREF9021_01822 [Simonsiella muelleri ATCC 29453]UBQ52947.1 hypothetical protein JF634_06885 [Simonsiella muelleri]
MKYKMLFLSAWLLTAHTAMAQPHLPAEMYQSSRGAIVKIKDRGDGEWYVKSVVRGSNVYRLSQYIESKARTHGYHLIGKDIRTNKADLSFENNRYRLNASIDLNSDNTMDYEIERELN